MGPGRGRTAASPRRPPGPCSYPVLGEGCIRGGCSEGPGRRAAQPPRPHPARSPQSTAPPGHPRHAERSQAPILHRTLQVPGRCWRREELPALSQHKRGQSPGPGGRITARPGRRAALAPTASFGVYPTLYIDKLKPLKLLNPSAESTGFIGGQPPPVCGEMPGRQEGPWGRAAPGELGLRG